MLIFFSSFIKRFCAISQWQPNCFWHIEDHNVIKADRHTDLVRLSFQLFSFLSSSHSSDEFLLLKFHFRECFSISFHCDSHWLRLEIKRKTNGIKVALNAVAMHTMVVLVSGRLKIVNILFSSLSVANVTILISLPCWFCVIEMTQSVAAVKSVFRRIPNAIFLFLTKWIHSNFATK